MTEARAIRRLDEDVVNRIAAGEVIVRPASALKELLENSLDAGARNIVVTCNQGGLKMMQIQDDGCGIRKEDMSIVCERFTTSKLSSFEDLQSIATFGFRGEALASITHVAHVSITTQTKESPCSWRASYRDGVLVAPGPGQPAAPKPCAGNAGTTITVEDLFYNVVTRRKAMRSAAEEYARILDVVQRYAVANPSAGFTCKKVRETIADVHTKPDSTTLDAIRTVYGNSVARELLPLTWEDQALAAECKGYVSNANYNLRRGIFILFINNRLVESPGLKRSLEAMYAPYLPKGTHPWLLLQLRLAPDTVDVNVHPSKSQVHFLNEERITEALQRCLESALLGANASRTYSVPTMLATGTAGTSTLATSLAQQRRNSRNSVVDIGNDADEEAPSSATAAQSSSVGAPAAASGGGGGGVHAARQQAAISRISGSAGPASASSGMAAAAGSKAPSRSRNDAKLVREDRTSQRGQMELYLARNASNVPRSISDLDAFAKRSGSGAEPVSKRARRDAEPSTPPTGRGGGAGIDGDGDGAADQGNAASATPAAQAISSSSGTATPSGAPRLRSIEQLVDAVLAEGHQDLSVMLRACTFVGAVDDTFCVVQHGTKLYLLNMPMLSRELAYQLVLLRFACMSMIRLPRGLPLVELARLGLDHPDAGWTPEDGSKDELARGIAQVLCDHSAMLDEYLAMEISSDAWLLSLPQIIDRYVPSMAALPLFIVRMGTEVDWSEEKACFDSLAHELAEFYAVQPSLFREARRSTTPTNDAPDSGQAESQSQSEGHGADDGEDTAAAAKQTESARRWVFHHTLLPAMRRYLTPQKSFASDGTVVQVAALENLYRIFERC